MINKIVEFYTQGKNERQIKDELLLLGFKKGAINKGFKVFVNKFNTVTEIFEYHETNNI